LGKGGSGHRYVDFNYNLVLAEIKHEVGTSVSKLKRILKDKRFDRYSGRFLSGQLNGRKLYKHRMGDMRLFKRKVLDDKRDFSFMLNVDISSSMRSGGRMEQAQKATVLLLEVLTECDVPVGLVTFGQHVHVVKEPNAQLNHQTLAERLTRLEGNTRLVEGATQSAQLLRAQGLSNKVHITITDGNVYGSDMRELKELQTKFKDIKFYGIGVNAELGQAFPSDHTFNLQNTGELMPTLLGILKSHIKS
jgi:hypothetical protein